MKIRTVLLAFFVLASALLAVACNDDVKFSTDQRDRLSFSSDTVSFDTIFTGLTSVAIPMKIYNRNADALRFDARIAGGSGSRFALNVDGQTGLAVTDVEIRDNDSLYCFVSVNPDADDRDLPFLVEDSIAFILQSGVVQYVRLRAYGQNVVVLNGISFDSDTILASARPYLVYDTIRVKEGATLTVAAGTEFCFHNGASLRVSGRLVVDGTAGSPVIMHGDRRDNMLDNIPYDLAAGRWGGIMIDSCSYGNTLDYCRIHGGEWGVKADTASLTDQKIVIRNSVIHNVSGNALELNNCRATIENSQITNAGGYCVNLLGGDNTFTFCTIANYYGWSTHNEAVSITNVCDSTIYPMLNAGFQYCVITGASADEITGTVVDSLEGYSSDALANYWIRNSLIMSPDTLNPRLKDNVFENKDSACYSFRNFIHVAQGDFRYDYRLDSLSMARGMVKENDVVLRYPADMLGTVRPAGKADAGCYQFK